MKLLKIYLLVQLLVSGQLVIASEIDSFTGRYQYQLKDSQNIIHQTANKMLQDALDETNKTGHCSEKDLYKNLRRYFQNHMKGQLTPFIIHSPLVSKFVLNFKDSIYRDFKWYDALSLIIIQTIYKNISGPIVKMGPYYIGADKFEHLFGRGYRYFIRYYKKQQSIEKVLAFGHRSERIFLGANTTGVYSYADLAANFNGMRFWNDILGHYPDILGEDQQIEPYVKCSRDRKWVQNSRINFLHYIDHSFDESINCSKFRTPKLLQKVLGQINELERTKGQRYTCPIALNSIDQLEIKYQDVQHKILNFRGHDSLK